MGATGKKELFLHSGLTCVGGNIIILFTGYKVKDKKTLEIQLQGDCFLFLLFFFFSSQPFNKRVWELLCIFWTVPLLKYCSWAPNSQGPKNYIEENHHLEIRTRNGEQCTLYSSLVTLPFPWVTIILHLFQGKQGAKSLYQHSDIFQSI